MKNLLSGLALIATLATPARTDAIIDGDGNVRSVAEPQYSVHGCAYKGFRLVVKCDEGCFISGVYDSKRGGK